MPKVLSDKQIAAFRERLIDAAERLFADHGVEAVTLRQIAQGLGVSPMTPYRYFADKTAILAATRARGFDRHAEALERAYDAAPDDARARADALLRAYVDFALANPEAYKLMFDIRQADQDKYPELVRAGERSRATMTMHLRALSESGAFSGDIERVGHMFWAALHGPLMLHFSGMLGEEQQVRDLIDSLAAALGRVVFTPGATAGAGAGAAGP